MPELLIGWIVRFSMLCLENYSAVVVSTAVVAFIMAAVLILIRQEILREEDWILYLGAAFGSFFFQYSLRTIAVWMRGGDYSRQHANFLEVFAQSLFSNLSSFCYLLAALSLLYRLPRDHWKRTKWGVLVAVFLGSAVAGVALTAPWDRYMDAVLSALCLCFLTWALFVNSGTRRKRSWASLNLVGGAGYAALNLAYAYVPTFVQWPGVAFALDKELGISIFTRAVQPSRAMVIDAGMFAIALAFKVSLFVSALVVVVRCLSAFSPSVGREVLGSVKTGRGEYLSGNGIVRAIGETIGADAAALYFRLPGSTSDLIVPFRWASGNTWSGFISTVPFQRPSRLESALGMTLAAEEIVWSRDRKTDSRFAHEMANDLGEDMRSLVVVPLLHHGAVIGSLNFQWKQTAAFTATDIQRVRQIADFVTPVVQTERWLRAVADLRGRLQSYNFNTEHRERGTFIGRIGEQVHDVLSPYGTLVLVNFGFSPQWVLCGPEFCSSDDPLESRNLEMIEDHFQRELWGLEAAFVRTDLKLDFESIGSIVLAVHRGRDPIDRPSLTQDMKQMESISALVKDVIFDLQHKRFSSIVHRLHSTLDERGFASEVHWMRTVRAAVAEAGLREIAVYPQQFRVHRAEPPDLTIRLEELEQVAEYSSRYRVYAWRPQDAPSQTVLEVPLETSGETLFFAVPREGFGKELDADLPWRVFLDRLALAADSSLVRIRAIELESEAMQFEMNDLLVHELRTPAEAFQRGVEWMEESLLEDAVLAPGDRKLLLLQDLKASARKFLELAHSVLKPVAADGRVQVSLAEVREQVDRFYEGRLAARSIDLHWTVQPESLLGVPIHLAYLVIVSLVQNSRDAIKTDAGRIHVQSEELADEILLHVDDNGAGIPDDIRPQIFNFGFSTKSRGSGRGLPLARRALNRYRGDLQLGDPPPGISTRFTIRVPKGV